ncbi:acyl-CoA reductase [Alkaliphilus crotonatoxidans]
MNSIYRGEAISTEDFIHQLKGLKENIVSDLLLNPPEPWVVIEAIDKLTGQLDQEEWARHLAERGMSMESASTFIKTIVKQLNSKALMQKLHTELGKGPFTWRQLGEGIEAREQPLGVIFHIGAGNALGLSVYSVIEGLLTGNINLVKLPQGDGGISTKLLLQLVNIEPRLKPYLYVIDLSSENKVIIQQLMEMVNGVAIWGSDEAIEAIRRLAPPAIPLIEWGQRLSFAYLTKKKREAKILRELAREICLTDQLYCSSPQCIFYETDSLKELEDLAQALSEEMKAMVKTFSEGERSPALQAQITLTHELVKMEEVLGQKKLITDEARSYGIMIDQRPMLKPSPLYRNIWLMPVKREALMELLWPHRGYLQTAGLSCADEEYEQLSKIFYAAGVKRITAWGQMSVDYTWEPHDGMLPLRLYTRIVTRSLLP